MSRSAGWIPLGIASLTELLTRTAADGVAVLFSSHQLDLVEDVCQDVVIIDHGTIVLAGVVQELKAAAPLRSLRIEVNGEPWVPALGGALTSREGGPQRALVDASVDLDEILAGARRAGEVTSFSYEPPSLGDLFREAVSKDRAR